MRQLAPYAAAAVATAAIAVAWTWPLALRATTHTALPDEAWDEPARLALLTYDQIYFISGAARNAAALLRGHPGALIDQALCHPVPASATLGEHMIELGVLALPGYALSGSPVLAYNTACWLLLVVAGLGAFALVRHWTGSSGAAFASALLFAFYPSRLGDLVHPSVVGIHWMPWVLLAFERLVERARLRDALGLAAAASLQCWVGSYPMMVLAFFAGPYGALRLLQQRARLDARRLGLLALAVALSGAAAALVLVPYVEAGETWGVLRQRFLSLAPFSALLPGGALSLGGLAWLLAAPLLLLRGPRPSGRSPVPALVLGAAVCLALCGGGPLWPGGPDFAGVYPWLAERVPLLGAVRAPSEIRYGVALGLALLAGLGLSRVLARLAPRHGRVGTVAVALVWTAIAVEIFLPRVALEVYGRSTLVALQRQAPDPDELAAYEALEAAGYSGPVLDLPLRSGGRGAFFRMPRYTLLAGYHLRPVAACFSSYAPPSFLALERMAARLPDPRGVDELVASGFRDAVLHHTRRPLPREAELTRRLAELPGVEVVATTPAATAYHFDRAVESQADPTTLDAVALRVEKPGRKWEKPNVAIVVANRADRLFALPRPIRPLPARARWWPRHGGAPGPWFDVRFLPPLALAAGAEDPAPIDLGRPPEDCDCVPEVEVPTLGWSLRARDADT